MTTSAKVYPAALEILIEDPTGDPRVVEAIKPYLESTKFHSVGLPERYFCPIRFMAGFALAEEMAAIGNFDPVVVHNTPLSIKPWEEDLRNLIHSIKVQGPSDPSIFLQRSLDACEKLFIEGKLRTTDLVINPDSSPSIVGNLIWRCNTSTTTHGKRNDLTNTSLSNPSCHNWKIPPIQSRWFLKRHRVQRRGIYKRRLERYIAHESEHI